MKKFWIVLVAALWGLLLLPFAVYVGALFIAHDCNPDFLKIDACMDAGGRWDYVNRVAVFENASGIREESKE